MAKKTFPVNENSKVTIQRGVHDKEHPYVMISKSMLRDPSLSIKAKGVLCYLLSLPDDWVTHPRQIAETLGISKNLMYDILKCLINAGYASKNDVKDCSGRFSSVQYFFYEEKIHISSEIKEQSTVSQKRYTEKRYPEKRTLQNKDSTEDISLQNKDLTSLKVSPQVSEQPAKAVMPAKAVEAKKHACKKNLLDVHEPEVEELEEKMIECLQSIKPDYKAKRTQIIAIHDAIDLMIRLDGRDPQTILDVFRWAVNDSFWQDKMFKPNPAKYLREKFDQLEMKMNAKAPEHRSNRKFAEYTTDKERKEMAAQLEASFKCG